MHVYKTTYIRARLLKSGYLISRINMIKRGRHAFVDESFGVFGFVDGVVGYRVVTSYPQQQQRDKHINNTE